MTNLPVLTKGSMGLTESKSRQREVVTQREETIAAMTHECARENTKMREGRGEYGSKPDEEEVARELGGEVVMDYAPSKPGMLTCVVMST